MSIGAGVWIGSPAQVGRGQVTLVVTGLEGHASPVWLPCYGHVALASLDGSAIRARVSVSS